MSSNKCRIFNRKHIGITSMLLALVIASPGYSALAKKQTPQQMSERLIRLGVFSNPQEIHGLAEDFEKHYGSSRDAGIMGSVARAMLLSGETYERTDRRDKAFEVYTRLVEAYSKTKRIDAYTVNKAMERIAVMQYEKKNYQEAGKMAISLLNRLKEDKQKHSPDLEISVKAFQIIKKINENTEYRFDLKSYISMLEQDTVLEKNATRTMTEYWQLELCLILAELYENQGKIDKAHSCYGTIQKFYSDHVGDSKMPEVLQKAQEAEARLKNDHAGT